MFYNQRTHEQKSIWAPTDSMPIISEVTTREPHIQPKYPSDNRQMQQYKQPWTPDISETNDPYGMVKSNGCSPQKKCIIVMLTMGILIGLFVCGVPLAVMTTLYLQQKAQTTSSGSLTTVSSGTISITSVTLPSQCTSYVSNSDGTRNIGFSGCFNCFCDDSVQITTGWYRFIGSAGTGLITTPVSVNKCGAVNTGWFNGSLPSTVGTATAGMVCVNTAGNLCNATYSINSVLVTNCNGFYVFYLTPMPFCTSRYCTT